MKLQHFFFIWISLCTVNQMYGQNGTRYKDLLFKETEIIKDLQYCNPQANGVKAKRNRLDLYLPENDTAVQRPLIVWIHGGVLNSAVKIPGHPAVEQNFCAAGICLCGC